MRYDVSGGFEAGCDAAKADICAVAGYWVNREVWLNATV